MLLVHGAAPDGAAHERRLFFPPPPADPAVAAVHAAAPDVALTRGPTSRAPPDRDAGHAREKAPFLDWAHPGPRRGRGGDMGLPADCCRPSTRRSPGRPRRRRSGRRAPRAARGATWTAEKRLRFGREPAAAPSPARNAARLQPRPAGKAALPGRARRRPCRACVHEHCSASAGSAPASARRSSSSAQL